MAMRADEHRMLWGCARINGCTSMAAAIRNRASLGPVGGAHSGLTFVAALLTVFLLGLLAALVLVTAWTARGAAKRATCTSQLRQLASALVMYKGQFGDYPPWSYEVRDSEGELLKSVTWQQILAPYVGDSHLFSCPRDVVGAADGKTAGAEARIHCSYDYIAKQEPEEARSDGARAAGSRRPGPRGRQKAAGAGVLLYCKHHDERRLGGRRWVLVAYEDGSVKWEPMPGHLQRMKMPARVPQPGRND